MQNRKDNQQTQSTQTPQTSQTQQSTQTPQTSQTQQSTQTPQTSPTNNSSDLTSLLRGYLNTLQTSIPSRPTYYNVSPTEFISQRITKLSPQTLGQQTTTPPIPAPTAIPQFRPTFSTTPTESKKSANAYGEVTIQVHDAVPYLSKWFDVKADAKIFLIPIKYFLVKDIGQTYENSIKRRIPNTDFGSKVSLYGEIYFLVTGEAWMNYGKRTIPRLNYVINKTIDEHLNEYKDAPLTNAKTIEKITKACEKANAKASGEIIPKKVQTETPIQKQLEGGLKEKVRYDITDIIKEPYQKYVNGIFPQITITLFTTEPEDIFVTLYRNACILDMPLSFKLFEGLIGNQYVFAIIMDEKSALHNPNIHLCMKAGENIELFPSSQIANLKNALELKKGKYGKTRYYLNECLQLVLQPERNKKRKNLNKTPPVQKDVLDENSSSATEVASPLQYTDVDIAEHTAKKQKTDTPVEFVNPMEDVRDVAFKANETSQMTSFNLFPPKSVLIAEEDSEEETEEEIIIEESLQKKTHY